MKLTTALSQLSYRFHTGGTRTRDLGLLKHVVPSAFAEPMRPAGLEPARFAPPASQAGASSSFATAASV